MTPARFDELIHRFTTLRVGLIGDFSLDRYFDIDPTRAELSLETNLPVHNVTQVRCQPGAAGNITTNLAALGAAALHPIGYCGDDGEGFELHRALARLPGLSLDHFQTTPLRKTFCYSKPLLHRAARPPEELSRLDLKDWTPTPSAVESRLIASLHALAPNLDALIVMDQAGVVGMGAITANVLTALADLQRAHPRLIILADSRHGLRRFPPLIYKLNATEFSTLTKPNCHVLRDSFLPPPAISPLNMESGPSKCHVIRDTLVAVEEFARRHQRAVFVTLAEAGMVGAAPNETPQHVPALPVRGPIDIVGAGDTVTAALTLALAAAATLAEAMEMAQAAASLVVHQLGTTGVAKPDELRQLLCL